MRSSEERFNYPIIAFMPDDDIYSFGNWDELSTCGRDTLRDNKQDGLELIDSDGRRWRVVSIRRTGGVGLSLGLSCFLDGVSRIDQELEPLASVTLDDVKARVGRAMQAFPTDWIESYDETMEQRLARVAATKSIAELEAMLGADHFRAY